MGLENILQLVVENFMNLIPIRIVRSYQQGVKFRFGKDVNLKNQGIYVYLPFVENMEIRDVNPEVINLPNQSIYTKDGESICVSGAVEYKITDLRKWWIGVRDFDNTIVNTAMGYLARDAITKTFKEMHENVKILERDVAHGLRMKTRDWGVNIIDFYITDFIPAKAIRLMTDSGGDIIKKSIWGANGE